MAVRVGEHDRRSVRVAVLSDIHLSQPGTPDGVWNNPTRRSVAGELLHAALDEITGSGHTRILVLGDISDDGSPQMIRSALTAIADAGLAAWAVPGNHDTVQQADAVESVAASIPECTALHRNPDWLADGVGLVGVGLDSAGGECWCTGVDLPTMRGRSDQMLVWAGHYPLLGQAARLRAAGLRYPGDLHNLPRVRRAVADFTGPVPALHGHLHAAVTRRAGRILQLGFPAVVEWPHAWTELCIELDTDAICVRTTTHPISGQWSRP